MYRHFFKHMIDAILSFLGIIVLAIPMIIIAIAIIIDSKGPVIFKQTRLGKEKKLFKVYKFRTMCEHAFEKGGVAHSETDNRITKVGAFLRKTSLDELPQMFNILKGEMAIIGPRPILDFELNEVVEPVKFNARFDALPGMFCTVDLDLRAKATRQQQFEMDVEYVKRMDFLLDCKVFFGIIRTVLSRTNVYKED